LKVVILAGGLGSRISEESHLIPKPMIEIGGRPLLWHVMQTYAMHGFNEFVVCLGYKGYVIKEYFANYALQHSDVTFDLAQNRTTFHKQDAESFIVTLVDTGLHSMTGARVKAVQEYTEGDTFMLTYGDGVGNVDILSLVEQHKKSEKIATVTAVEPPGRFGTLAIKDSGEVLGFEEKPLNSGSWINAGYFVLQPEVFDYIDDGEDCVWEQRPMRALARASQLGAYRHDGFWQPMDTLRDKRYLEDILESGTVPWLSQ
jgi:glucose-1-phosphate cytidylyltransferase